MKYIFEILVYSMLFYSPFGYAMDIDTSNVIHPLGPSMNNGVPYIPMQPIDKTLYGTVTNNQANDSKPKITGTPDIEKLDAYKSLLKDDKNDIKRFCANMGDSVRENYFAVQTKKLQELKTEIDKRIVILEQKKNEYKDWLTKRNLFLKKAKISLINIISKMDPEEAAGQLAKLDELSAASLLMKLKPRIASSIMNNMQPEKAAYLEQIIIDAQHLPNKDNAIEQKTNMSDIPKPIE